MLSHGSPQAIDSLGNVISATSLDESSVSSAGYLAASAENSAGSLDEDTVWLSETKNEAAPGAPVKCLYPSTETFEEPACWSSPKEFDTALPLSARETPVVPRTGPRLISATPSVLEATRSLWSPGRLSPCLDEEQWMLSQPETHEGGPGPGRIPSRQVSGADDTDEVKTLQSKESSLEVSMEVNDLTGSLMEESSPPRLSGLARALLVAGAVLGLVSALIALVAWRLTTESLGGDLMQDVFVKLPRVERLLSSSGGVEADSQDKDFANGSVTAQNLSG